jgi:hypothetical protein
MIDKIFNSAGNRNAIKSIINDKILSTNNTNINNNFDDIIIETMSYVKSKVSSKPPSGIDQEQYLLLMNKKVYDIVTPIIIKKLENKNISLQKTIIEKKNIGIMKDNFPKDNFPKDSFPKDNFTKKSNKDVNFNQDTLFDPLLMRNYDIPAVMDYPKPGANLKNIESNTINVQMKNLEDERSTLTPKLKPIDFSIKDDTKNNTVQLYNELLTNYNSQVDSMENFESSQKKINETIEKIENYQFTNNDNKTFSPIDLLGNKNESKNFFEINDNNIKNINKDTLKSVAYNRNDIETFINNDYDTDNNTNNIETYNPDLNNNYNHSVTTYNSNNLNKPEFSNVFQENSKILFKEPSFQLIEKKFYIIFDSSDRDLYEYPNPTSFQVKFAPAGNNLSYQNYYDEYSTLILKERVIVYGDNSNLSVQETFDNINNISIKSVNVPTNIIYVGSTDPQETNTGNPLSIFNQSYLYLVIPELRGPYTGGNLLAYNSFAKLLVDYSSNTNSNTSTSISKFTILKTADYSETFLYDPISAGKVDKMTLNLLNKNGLQYNFGIDKLFINSFIQGNNRYNGYCGNQFLTTIIQIQPENNEYIKYCSLYNKIGDCNIINSHPIVNGDLLYFYNTRPSIDQIVYFEDYVNISKLKYDKPNKKLKIYLSYEKNFDNNEIKNININPKNIIPGANINNENIYKTYYIILFDTKKNYHYYFTIDTITNTFITVNCNDNIPIFRNYSNIKVGLAKNNPRGLNSDDKNSLFSKNGYNVISVGTTIENQWNIEIDCPYLNLPEYILNSTGYYPGEIFLIQEKLQISYTFTVTIQTKDYQKIQSGLNESGNN